MSHEALNLEMQQKGAPKLRIGSELALWQANYIAALSRRHDWTRKARP